MALFSGLNGLYKFERFVIDTVVVVAGNMIYVILLTTELDLLCCYLLKLSKDCKWQQITEMQFSIVRTNILISAISVNENRAARSYFFANESPKES